MILNDGYLTNTKGFRHSPKFGGARSTLSYMSAFWLLDAEMTGYLWTLSLISMDDDSDSDPDLGEGWSRFGKRVLYWASSGATAHETFETEDEAIAWCEANRYERSDDD